MHERSLLEDLTLHMIATAILLDVDTTLRATLSSQVLDRLQGHLLFGHLHLTTTIGMIRTNTVHTHVEVAVWAGDLVATIGLDRLSGLFGLHVLDPTVLGGEVASAIEVQATHIIFVLA